MVTIVTDDGGPFRSLNFELFITSHPELRHIRTRVRTPRQSGSPERGFATLKYERLFLDDIPDALTLVERAEDYRIEYNTARPHEAIARNRPLRNLSRARRPRHPHLRTRRNPANYLTRDMRAAGGVWVAGDWGEDMVRLSHDPVELIRPQPLDVPKLTLPLTATSRRD